MSAGTIAKSSFELMAEYTDDVVVRVGPDGNVIYVSPTVRKYGYEPEQIRGTDGLSLIHPEDQARLAENAAALRRGEMDPTVNRQYRFRRANGEWVWVEGDPRIVRDRDGQPVEVLNVFRDVSHRSEANTKAREQAELFEAAFQSAAIGKALSSLSGRFLRINEAFCRITGYSRAALLKMKFQAITHPDDLHADLAFATRLMAGEMDSYRLDKRYVRADGSVVWVHLSLAMVRNADGSPKCYVAQVQDLTEHKQAEAALRQSEARYRTLTENLTDVIACYGRDGVLKFLSPAVKALLGYEPSELVGCSIAPLIHPDDVEPGKRHFREHLDGGPGATPFRVECRMFRKDGSVVWVEAHPRAVYDSSTGAFVEWQDLFRDISDRRAVEHALAESEARFRLLAESANDLILQVHPDGRILYISPSCLGVTGYAPEELIGRSPLDWAHPEDAPGLLAAVEAQVAGGGKAPPTRVEFRIRTKEGRDVWLEARPCAVVDPSTGAVASLTDVVRDITDRKRLEEQLVAARVEAEAATATKSQFLANMSHEIRTPLTAVLGFTGLLRDDPTVRGEAATYVQRIAAAGSNLLAIVNDVLDFSKLDAGKVEIRPSPTPLARVCEETLFMFGGQAEAKGLRLECRIDDRLPDVVMLDSDRLRQMLINLVGNAIKFTDVGGVTVRVNPAAEPDVVQIEVEDTGPGLDDEAQARLFQRFTQIDGSMTRRHGGTGLGLAICRGLAEAMGGSIGVTSELGRGACFRLTLAAPAAAMPADVAQADLAPALAAIRVLVTDDNATNRDLSRRLLEAAGVEVIEAADGHEALEQLAGQAVDVVLMDLRMPGLDGHAALLRLRATAGPNRNTPVLAFTADVDVHARGLADFDGLVRKPIVAADLLRAIAAALDDAPIEAAGDRDAVAPYA